MTGGRLTRHVLFSYAFRPMFLGLAGFAVVSMAVWLAVLISKDAVLSARFDSLWHGHEMLFGFALAAAAGFLLTAVANWTGRPPVARGLLLTVVVTWLLGRVVMLVWVWPPPWAVAVALAFPLLLTLVVAREVVLGGSRRNYPVVAIVAALMLCDVGYHLGRLGVAPGMDRLAPLAALYVFVLLVTMIGGRIIPAFTANWLRAQGNRHLPQSSPSVELLTPLFTLLSGFAALMAPSHPATGTVAAITAVLHAVRLARWRGSSTWGEPLLLILHVAYAWLPIGFMLLALSAFGGPLPQTSALHALAVGVLSVMILAVTTRVALGHTGRPLRAAPATVVAYAVLNMAAIVRVAAPAAGPNYLVAIELAALAWIIAWLLFLWTYTPILIRPRIDSHNDDTGGHRAAPNAARQ